MIIIITSAVGRNPILTYYFGDVNLEMKKYLDPGFCYCFPPHNYFCDHCRRGLEMTNFDDVTKLDVFSRLLKDMGRINGIIEEAEEWAERQLMPEDRITMGALKDIRRVARRWKKMTPAPEKEKKK